MDPTTRIHGAIPVLGLGTWEVDGVVGMKAVKEALEMGYRHLDTAQMYGNEEMVGQAIFESGVDRNEIFLTTKLAMDNLRQQRVGPALDESLTKLRTDYVDLLLIHWPSPSVPLEETLTAMAAERKAGRVRHVGVSNFTVALMKDALAAADAPILCNQIEYHPYLSQDPVIAFCHEHEVAVTAYSPLARGRVATDERLAEIGKPHGKSAAQVALRWLVQKPGVAVIPKATKPEHVAADFQIFDFELDDRAMTAIDELGEGERIIDPPWAPRWDEV